MPPRPARAARNTADAPTETKTRAQNGANDGSPSGAQSRASNRLMGDAPGARLGDDAVAHAVFIVIPRFSQLALTAAIEPMRIANYLAPTPRYAWSFVSTEGGPVPASNGMSLDTVPLSEAGEARWAFVCGSWGCETAAPPALYGWLRRLALKGVTLGAIDLGAYVLARAGLMSGKAATVHWSCLAGFAEQFPEVDAREQLYTVDKSVLTCAGGVSGMDLMLHVIAERDGEHLAHEVADQIMHHPLREPNTRPRQTFGGRQPDLHPSVRAAIALMEDNFEEPLSVPEIAAGVGVSQRHLERLFYAAMGCSVVQFRLLLRLQYARVLLTSTKLSVREVSAACGFNSMTYFSQAFQRCFEKKPSAYRLAWPENETAPTWPGTVFSLVERSKRGRTKAKSDRKPTKHAVQDAFPPDEPSG